MPHVSSRISRLLVAIVILAACALTPAAQVDEIEGLFQQGLTWEQFLDGVKAQRAGWLKLASDAVVPPDLAARFDRVSKRLRILVVAEDWCPDSLNTVPYVAALAAAASTPLRIVDRKQGEPLASRHRTPDGRTATPTIVLFRDGEDLGAWVERPAVVQQWFLSMATDADSARRFGDRLSWYESDHGHAVLAEVIDLAERAMQKR